MFPQSTTSGARAAEKNPGIWLVAGATPASGWERVLPLLEHAGFARPEASLMQRWVAAARDAAPVGRPGIVTLKPTPLNPALRAATDELFSACPPPVAIAIDSDDPEALAEFWEREIPGTRLLLFHARPERALVEAMRGGADPIPALVRWVDAGARALAVYRANRSRVTLVDADCALAAPAEFLQACASYLGAIPSGALPDASQIAPEASDVEHLIAALAIAQSREANRLFAELEACSLPIGAPSEPPVVDCDRVFRDLREDQAWLEEAVRERDEAVAELAGTKTTLREREGTLGEAEAGLQEARRENDLLLLQLHQVQEELEATFQQTRGLRETNDAYAAERERLQGEIGNLISSRDEQERRLAELLAAHDRQAKAAAELKARLAQLGQDQDRQAKLAADREAELTTLRQARESLAVRLKEANEENKLLLLQLHQVQEEFEAQYIDAESWREKLRKTEEQRDTLSARIRIRDEQIIHKNKIIHNRERRIRYFEHSISWKITKPLRAIRSIFGGRNLAVESEKS